MIKSLGDKSSEFLYHAMSSSELPDHKKKARFDIQVQLVQIFTTVIDCIRCGKELQIQRASPRIKFAGLSLRIFIAVTESEDSPWELLERKFAATNRSSRGNYQQFTQGSMVSIPRVRSQTPLVFLFRCYLLTGFRVSLNESARSRKWTRLLTGWNQGRLSGRWRCMAPAAPARVLLRQDTWSKNSMKKTITPYFGYMQRQLPLCGRVSRTLLCDCS